MTLPPLTEYSLQDAADAHRQIQGGYIRGRTVLKIADIDSAIGRRTAPESTDRRGQIRRELEGVAGMRDGV